MTGASAAKGWVQISRARRRTWPLIAFGERLDRRDTEGQSVGHVYANTIAHGDRYWQRTTPAPAAKYTDHPAVALKEIGVRPSWRKTGTARRIHDTLLANREDQPYVTLMVNPAAGDGKVHALYQSWGYEDLGRSQPSAASPVLTVMIRTVRLGPQDM
ncbi:GNAT family N-acetyltransferase [Streptomyces sp. J2-1]|uniref:GNAT family N-acetyltransferase n=1 Tax=Streptomyces corallincola TaxID=2851888 RepID=UPI001C38D51A|nr:GNAT family N-acetyltransferase [Streptomyces corallincola]MBV2353326.1 GNAT family N-acetyltransferase [Streptomyces corallincola]